VQACIDLQSILFYPAHRQLPEITRKYETPQSRMVSFPVNPAKMRRIISKTEQIRHARRAAGRWRQP
jgi:hypothetical protein